MIGLLEQAASLFKLVSGSVPAMVLFYQSHDPNAIITISLS